jgi:hypothetical protein
MEGAWHHRRSATPKGEGNKKESKKDGWVERPPILFREACDIGQNWPNGG